MGRIKHEIFDYEEHDRVRLKDLEGENLDDKMIAINKEIKNKLDEIEDLKEELCDLKSHKSNIEELIAERNDLRL